MKPVSFDYFRPASLEEAIALLHYYGGDAKLLAGGQSLIPLLNMRLARPSALIDLSGIPDLDDIKQDGQVLAIGAMVRHHSVECSTLVAERCPLLREAMSYVGHVAIRTRGTFGGGTRCDRAAGCIFPYCWPHGRAQRPLAQLLCDRSEEYIDYHGRYSKRALWHRYIRQPGGRLGQ